MVSFIMANMTTTITRIRITRISTNQKIQLKYPSLLLLLLFLQQLLSNAPGGVMASSSVTTTDLESDGDVVDCADDDTNRTNDIHNNLVCMNQNHDSSNSNDRVESKTTSFAAPEGSFSLLYQPRCIQVLKERKAHLCWHKHSTFLDHLVSVHDILLRWMKLSSSSSSFSTENDDIHSENDDDWTMIPRIGLFHSAYSNSYVNLALFNVTTERQVVQQLIGITAEEYVYIFCSINRQEVVVNTLLHQNYIPPEGLRVPHLRHANETIYLSARTLYILLIFTMADIADQYFDWQDLLFGGGNTDGSMILPGYDIYFERHNTKALWPGLSKPGLWMSYVSQLGHVARTYHNSTSTTGSTTTTTSASLGVPTLTPVFDNGTKVLLPNDELIARDLYWSVINGVISDEMEIIVTLQACMEKNPFIFEPIVLLSQVYAHRNDYTTTILYATKAMDLQQQWGIAWDKRMSYSAWVAWTKVLLQRAQQQLPWPTNAWDVNNLGYVY